MDEFKFVLKCFIFASLLMCLTQLKTDGLTLEARLHGFLISSPVAEFVNKSAQGGVKLIEEFSIRVKKTVNTWFGSSTNFSHNESETIVKRPIYKFNQQRVPENEKGQRAEADLESIESDLDRE
jgi:hypothetical protein